MHSSRKEKAKGRAGRLEQPISQAQHALAQLTNGLATAPAKVQMDEYRIRTEKRKEKYNKKGVEYLETQREAQKTI